MRGGEAFGGGYGRDLVNVDGGAEEEDALDGGVGKEAASGGIEGWHGEQEDDGDVACSFEDMAFTTATGQLSQLQPRSLGRNDPQKFFPPLAKRPLHLEI